MNTAKLLFAGTPDFALASLRALVNAGFVPAAVLTQPDRPAGRGKKLSASPVKKFALQEKIPLWQPETLKDPALVSKMIDMQPDAIVVAAYGLILPQTVLDIPRHGCVNVHASILSRWRGAAPIQQAILEGDSETGISLMQMEAGLDCGPVFATSVTPIGAGETAGELHDRLALLGGELLVAKLPEILEGTLESVSQDDSLATYAGKIKTADAAITWVDSAHKVLRKIRAFNPIPGAFFDLDGARIKCWRAELHEGIAGSAGTILAAGKEGIDVACSEGGVRLLEVQRPGGRRIAAAEFAAQSELQGKQLGYL